MPPEADTVTVVVPPLQLMVPAEEEAVNAEGCVIFTEQTALQILASVTVTEYVFAVKLLMDETVAPLLQR